MFLPALAVLTTMHFEGDVPLGGDDFIEVSFPVPANTAEIRVAHTDGSDADIIDWGVWSPDGFRGYGGGLTDDAVIGVHESSRGYLPGAITPGTWYVSVGKAQLDANGGHYSIDVTCSDTESLPVQMRAAFAPVMLKPDRRWYKGDFHVHSLNSGDADATFDQISALARMHGLDFVNLSDHNTVAQHALLAAYMQAHMDLLLLRGAEITTYKGHGNAVGIHAYVDHRIGHDGRTINQVLDDVGSQGGIFLVNHPKLDLGNNCIGCAWRHDDTDWAKVTGIEITTGNWDIGVNAFVPQVIAMWDSLLDQGFRITAVGGSDDHRAGRDTGSIRSEIATPTTLVLADNLSEAAIIDGLKHGHTIVQLRRSEDPLVAVTMRAKDGSAAEIGDDVDGISKVHLDIHVTGGSGTFVQVWRDGKKQDPQIAVTSDDFTTKFEQSPGAGDTRYRVELISDANQRLVVTSHFWVHAVAASGGCETTGGSEGVLLAFGLLVLYNRGRANAHRHDIARRRRRERGNPDRR